MRRSALRLALTGCAVLALSACVTEPPKVAVADQPIAIAGVSHDQLLADVRVLSADDMEGRDTGSAGGERARNYIVSRLDAMDVRPAPFGRLQRFEAPGRTREGVKTFNGVNIIGFIPGTRVADRYIVITAHYDHVGINGGQIFNGADDNASGVATMLELAARLKANPPEHSVLIVALDGEERGLLGAREFVASPPVPLSAMSLNLNFDMISRPETDGHLWVTGTYQHPNLRPILAALPANGAVSLAFGKDTPQDKEEDNWVDASDHAAFHEKGVPFLYLGVDYHPDYHRPSDDFERITPSVFVSASELAIAAFHALDKALDR
nr:M28 family peptidase [uncultured Brevundimonas sp.]